MKKKYLHLSFIFISLTWCALLFQNCNKMSSSLSSKSDIKFDNLNTCENPDFINYPACDVCKDGSKKFPSCLTVIPTPDNLNQCDRIELINYEQLSKDKIRLYLNVKSRDINISEGQEITKSRVNDEGQLDYTFSINKASPINLELSNTSCNKPGYSFKFDVPFAKEISVADKNRLDNLLNSKLDSVFKGKIIFKIQKFGYDIYTYQRSEINDTNVMMVASLTKLVTSINLMKLWDKQKFNLDDYVVNHLPEFNNSRKNEIKIKQLMAHTAGFKSDSDHEQNTNITLQEAVSRIAADNNIMLSIPGATARYGGVGFQVAMGLTEKFANKSYKDYFNEAVLAPCKMQNTIYNTDHYRNNPNGGMGLQTNAKDYLALLKMFNSGGFCGSQRILSTNAINEIIKSQTDGVNDQYGLGIWRLHHENSKLVEVGHGSMFGQYAWSNIIKKYYAVLLIPPGTSDFQNYDDIRELVRSIVE